MSFVQLFKILWARRLLIVAITLGCFLTATVVGLSLPKRYEARSRVMLDIVKPDPVTGQMLATSFARAYMKTQTELVTDYGVTGAVVDDLGWAKAPALIEAYNKRSSGEAMDIRRWLAQRIGESTRATQIEGSNILEIGYSTSSPEAARKVADALRRAYIAQSVAVRREAATRNAEWFQEEADKIRQQLVAVEKQKTQFERANGVVLQDDFSDPESARLKALANQAPMPTMGVAAAPVSSPSAAQLAQVDAQLAAASQNLGPNHPEIIQLRQQRSALASAAAQERAASMAASRSGGGGGGISIAEQQRKVLEKRGTVDELRQIQANIVVLRDQYAKTAGRVAELRQESASRESGISMLGGAIAPDSPSWPNVPLILIGSLAAGLTFGVLAAMIIELLNRKVRGIEDLGQMGVPLIGIIVPAPESRHKRSLLSRIGLGGAEAT